MTLDFQTWHRNRFQANRKKIQTQIMNRIVRNIKLFNLRLRHIRNLKQTIIIQIQYLQTRQQLNRYRIKLLNLIIRQIRRTQLRKHIQPISWCQLHIRQINRCRRRNMLNQSICRRILGKNRLQHFNRYRLLKWCINWCHWSENLENYFDKLCFNTFFY